MLQTNGVHSVNRHFTPNFSSLQNVLSQVSQIQPWWSWIRLGFEISKWILSQWSRATWPESCCVTGGFRFLVRLVFLSSNPRGQLFFQLILWTKFKMAWWSQMASVFSRYLSWLLVSKSVCFNPNSTNGSQSVAAVWISLSLSSCLSLSLPLCSTCACCLSVSVCPWSYSRWEGRRSPPLLPLSAEGPSAAV